MSLVTLAVLTNCFPADGGTQQRLRNLCAHAVSLEQQFEQEVRQAEVIIIFQIFLESIILNPC